MDFQCKSIRGKSSEKWSGRVKQIRDFGSHYEI